MAQDVAIGQHGDDHIRTRCGRGSTFGHGNAFDRDICHIKAGHVMACLGEVCRHRAAHVAKSDKSDFHVFSPLQNSEHSARAAGASGSRPLLALCHRCIATWAICPCR